MSSLFFPVVFVNISSYFVKKKNILVLRKPIVLSIYLHSKILKLSNFFLAVSSCACSYEPPYHRPDSIPIGQIDLFTFLVMRFRGLCSSMKLFSSLYTFSKLILSRWQTIRRKCVSDWVTFLKCNNKHILLIIYYG